MKVNGFSFPRFVIMVWILSIGSVSYLSLIPQAEFLSYFRWSDKLYHFLAYVWLSFLPFFGFADTKNALKWSLSMILLGIGLEFAQSFVPGRLFSLWDMIANSLGAITGILGGMNIRTRGH
jgi:glycopeptide antibiotics resistance protein